MIRTLNYFIQDRMPNGRPPPHPCVYPDLGGVGCLRKCKSSILSGLPQANTLGTRQSLISRPAVVARRCHRGSLFSRQFTKTIGFAMVALRTVRLVECPGARRNLCRSDGSSKATCSAGRGPRVLPYRAQGNLGNVTWYRPEATYRYKSHGHSCRPNRRVPQSQGTPRNGSMLAQRFCNLE